MNWLDKLGWAAVGAFAATMPIALVELWRDFRKIRRHNFRKPRNER